MAISTYLADVWSATDFGDPALSGYAESQLCRDTRFGIQAMAGLSLLMQLCVIVLILSRGLGQLYLDSSLLFGLLSLHVLISAAFLKDVRSLNALGMVFLTIGALSLTVLAHRSGELHIGMMAATVMLFVAIPLVPWAMREVLTITGLTYALLTTSLIAVPGRFASESFWVLQLLVLGSAVIAIVVTARNTSIRKHDIRARFDLENAHAEMEQLSMQDHLTGAWNRRYLSENFSEFAQCCVDEDKAMHLAILDIDDFKGINDEFGHLFGDRILISVADIFVDLLGENGRLIRLGGDEFQIIYCGDDLDKLIESAITGLQREFVDSGIASTRTISLSAGIVRSEPGKLPELETLYKAADQALYREKHHRPANDDDIN
ncbi:MAG: GGDEF domain-containing protein, partial [Woeseiaceae bacterium]